MKIKNQGDVFNQVFKSNWVSRYLFLMKLVIERLTVFHWNQRTWLEMSETKSWRCVFLVAFTSTEQSIWHFLCECLDNLQPKTAKTSFVFWYLNAYQKLNDSHSFLCRHIFHTWVVRLNDSLDTNYEKHATIWKCTTDGVEPFAQFSYFFGCLHTKICSLW